MRVEAFEITGPSVLSGEVRVSGSKNAALAIMFASLMCSEGVEIRNVPDVVDIHTSLDLFRSLGVPVEYANNTVAVRPYRIQHQVAPYELVKRMRASILCLGPLVAKYGEAAVSFPGGCAIGARPINLHLAALKQLGANIEVAEGYVRVKARGLAGAAYRFPRKSVTGTANLVCAAALTRGETRVRNAAREPEIVDLCRFLKSCGADIEGEGTSTIIVRGVEKLRGGAYTVMPDRIEWGTYAIAAAATGGELILRCADIAADTANIARALAKAGVRVEFDGDSARVYPAKKLRAVSITTQPFPGFPTDLQAQWIALMTQAQGAAVITETVFENRFMHVGELQRLGADIVLEGARKAFVHGRPGGLTGAELMATDLRASASLVIAALCARGTTTIRRIYHLDRGYERMDEKLRALGVTIRRLHVPV